MKKSKRNFEGMLIILLVIVPLIMLSGFNTPLYENSLYSDDLAANSQTDDVTLRIEDEKSYIGNYSFSPERFADYIGSLLDNNKAIFHENVGGYSTTIATYEALAALRIFGLDYYQFGDKWQINEDAIADFFYIDFEDPSNSGGYLLTEEAKNPSVEGTFGVVNSFWLMDELNTRLKPFAPNLVNYVINQTFRTVEGGFHEIGSTSDLKTTFQALSILETIYNLILELIDDVNPVPQEVNQSMEDFMGNHLGDIFNFVNDSFVDNTYFHDNNEFRTPIENTWYAVKSIAILERFSNLYGILISKGLIDYQIPVTAWLNSLVKSSGITKGGFGFGEYATTKETGLAYAIHNLFNTTDSIDDSTAIAFVNSSQFLQHENRTYVTSERIHLGGFGPNNITYSDIDLNNKINIHDTYYASLAYLLSGSVFESIDLSLETSFFQENPEINISSYLIQGEITSLEVILTSYDYKSHGSLNLITSIDNWDITHPSYDEHNSAFYGQDVAKYEITIKNDSDSAYNWTLGSHFVTNKISIRNLPIIPSPEYLLNTSVIVGYAPRYDLTPALIKPGDIVNATVYYQNRSTLTYESTNISEGDLSVSITSPNDKLTNLLDLEPINISTTAVKFNIPFLNNSLLGDYKLTLSFNVSSFLVDIMIPIVVYDDITIVEIENVSDYNPGDSMNINVSLEYSNGFFTPNANATLFFISNKTQSEVFNLSLEHIVGNTYTSNSQNCPTRFLAGFYNLTVKLYWNTSTGYKIDSLNNGSLQNIQIKGVPLLYLSPLKTDYRNTQQTEDASIFYGETVNFSFNIGFDTSAGILNITESDTKLMVGLFNHSNEDLYIQVFDIFQSNETFYASALINPNLGARTYGTSFKITSEWNNSFVSIKNPSDTSVARKFDLTLEGEFSLDASYYSNSVTSGLPTYSLEDSVITITFKVTNTLYENIPVPYLNLYGYLDIQGRLGTLNQSLPSITAAIDENGAHIYFLSISTSNLDPNTYEISIYTRTAISSNLKIGSLLPGFKLISTFNPTPVIQLHEALIVILGGIFIGLLYLNFRKKP
ncbi:MAG: hypothetical protein ACW97W_16445 [Candidatus Hodarchaeales archaeon]|jgi:hypothetical protein